MIAGDGIRGQRYPSDYAVPVGAHPPGPTVAGTPPPGTPPLEAPAPGPPATVTPPPGPPSPGAPPPGTVAAGTHAPGTPALGEPRGAVWLAIDSATDAIGIAVLADALMHEAHWRTRRRHTELLTAKVAEALAACDLTVPDVVGVAVALGPGSYTGLRIGLAFAKGLAIGTGLTVAGVPTLDIVAAPLSPPSVPRMATLWAVLSAGRGRIVAAPYPPLAGDWPPPSGLGVWTPDDLVAAVRPGDWVAGEMGLALVTRLEDAGCLVAPPAARVRRAGWLAELGRARVAQAQDVGLDDLVPVYASPGAAP